MATFLPDFGTPTPSPLGSKKARQAARAKAKAESLLMLRSPDRKKYRIALKNNQHCWVWEAGEWKRHYNLFSSDPWEPVESDLEMLVMTGISAEQIKEKAEMLRKLKQNRQQITAARWNKGRPCV